MIEYSVGAPSELCAEPLSFPMDGGDLGEVAVRVVALIHEGHLDRALQEIRALPTSIPQLPAITRELVLALAHVGKHDDMAALAAEMMMRFPLRPEVVRTLVELASILADQSHFRQLFHELSMAVVRTYAFSDAALVEWGQRMAYQFRRHGNPAASDYMLRLLARRVVH